LPSHYISYTSRPRLDRRGWRSLRFLQPYLWEYRGRVLLAVGALLLAKLATVAVPLVLKHVIDALDASKNRALALPIALLVAYGVLRLLSALFNELRDAIFARVRFRAMRRLSTEVLAHLHELGMRFHLERRTGAISRDLERGARSVSSLLNYLIFNIVPTLVEFALVAGILLTHYQPRFAVATFGAVAAYVVFTLSITEWRMDFRHAMNALDSRANNQAVDSLINYETVKSFTNERLEVRRYDDTLASWEDAAVKTQTSMSLLNFGQGAIIAAGVTLIMLFAAQGVAHGSLTLGDLVLVNAFLLQLFMPLSILGIVYRQVKYALADMDLTFKLLGKEPEIRDRPDAPPLRIRRGVVRFEHVHHAYGPDRQTLCDVDFVIPAGHKVAIVGPSGAGKSTLARLLFRYYDVTGGRILIDDQDVREVSQQSLRRAIGIVPQDTVLFNESIYYNIVYGRPDANREDVLRAARLAHIHDFVDSLPQGYDTLVGERGLKLSGGEKQRMAIARAMIKSPRILVFDEATSSLDSASEQAILGALQEVAASHTTLVIAHRLSTIVDADQVLVLEEGRIAERGTHRELLSAGGLYARMWALQQEERRSAEASDRPGRLHGWEAPRKAV
jgi:ABC-type transport system involved in Fe-S cluster assembly fused permease/ATPase subunit